MTYSQYKNNGIAYSARDTSSQAAEAAWARGGSSSVRTTEFKFHVDAENHQKSPAPPASPRPPANRQMSGRRPNPTGPSPRVPSGRVGGVVPYSTVQSSVPNARMVIENTRPISVTESPGLSGQVRRTLAKAAGYQSPQKQYQMAISQQFSPQVVQASSPSHASRGHSQVGQYTSHSQSYSSSRSLMQGESPQSSAARQYLSGSNITKPAYSSRNQAAGVRPTSAMRRAALLSARRVVVDQSGGVRTSADRPGDQEDEDNRPGVAGSAPNAAQGVRKYLTTESPTRGIIAQHQVVSLRATHPAPQPAAGGGGGGGGGVESSGSTSSVTAGRYDRPASTVPTSGVVGGYKYSGSSSVGTSPVPQSPTAARASNSVNPRPIGNGPPPSSSAYYRQQHAPSASSVSAANPASSYRRSTDTSPTPDPNRGTSTSNPNVSYRGQVPTTHVVVPTSGGGSGSSSASSSSRMVATTPRGNTGVTSSSSSSAAASRIHRAVADFNQGSESSRRAGGAMSGRQSSTSPWSRQDQEEKRSQSSMSGSVAASSYRRGSGAGAGGAGGAGGGGSSTTTPTPGHTTHRGQDTSRTSQSRVPTKGASSKTNTPRESPPVSHRGGGSDTQRSSQRSHRAGETPRERGDLTGRRLSKALDDPDDGGVGSIGAHSPHTGVNINSPRVVPPSEENGFLRGYTLGRLLGEGGFCKVRLGVHTFTGLTVAVKMIDKSKLVEVNDRRRVGREIRVLKRLTCEGIIKLSEVVDAPENIYVVMEYADGGSLLDYVRTRKRLDEAEARHFCCQMLQSLAHCHRCMVVHRDVKLENVLLDRQRNLKIIDFGLSAFLSPGKKLRVHCGSPSYAAPEIISRKLYDGPPVDMWSLGVVCFAMLTGYLPFHAGANKQELCQKIVNGHFTCPDFLSPGANDLMHRMLTVEPDERIDFVQIFQHPWLKHGVPCRQLWYYTPPPSGDRTNRTNASSMETYRPTLEVDEEVVDTLESLGVNRVQVHEAVSQNHHDYISTSYFLLHTKRSSYQSDAAAHTAQCPCLDKVPPSREWLKSAMETAALDDNNPYSLRLLDTEGGISKRGGHTPTPSSTRGGAAAGGGGHHNHDQDDDSCNYDSPKVFTKTSGHSPAIGVPKLRHPVMENGSGGATTGTSTNGTPRESPRPLSAPPTSTGNTPRVMGSQNPTPRNSQTRQAAATPQSGKPATPTSEEIRQAYFQAIPVT